MTEMTQQPVIVSDLDGTLLDHHSYSFAAAESLLHRLGQLHIPVVLCTSKTRAEVMQLRQQMNNEAPFIVENGAAIYLPREQFELPPAGAVERDDFWVLELCPAREHWLHLLSKAQAKFAGLFDHFANMTDAQVAEITGLNLQQASLARRREYGEPVQWLGSEEELQAFVQWFGEQGARVLRGGRFVHIAGQSDKGAALQQLVNIYRQALPDKTVVSLALGDSHNDVDMLEVADYAVVVRSPVHAPPSLKRSDGVTVSSAMGPSGWNQEVSRWLRQLLPTQDKDFSTDGV